MYMTWTVEGPLNELKILQSELLQDSGMRVTFSGPTEKVPEFLDANSFRYSPLAELVIAYASGVGAAATIELSRYIVQKVARRKGVRITDSKETKHSGQAQEAKPNEAKAEE
jgi:hypothetical protein